MEETSYIKSLKVIAPETFEHFRNTYLRKKFKYWKEDGKPEVYFCSMPFKTQLGYFLEYSGQYIKFSLKSDDSETTQKSIITGIFRQLENLKP